MISPALCSCWFGTVVVILPPPPPSPFLQAKFQWAIDEIINSDSEVKFEW
jgi:hypothetical protein